MHTVFALLCFVVVIHWLIFPYPSGLLHWHCGNLTIAPVPAKQPWWIWINTSFEFIMNDYITTTKQSTTKPCAYFLGYTVLACPTKLNYASWITQTPLGSNVLQYHHYRRRPERVWNSMLMVTIHVCLRVNNLSVSGYINLTHDIGLKAMMVMA